MNKEIKGHAVRTGKEKDTQTLRNKKKKRCTPEKRREIKKRSCTFEKNAKTWLRISLEKKKGGPTPRGRKERKTEL